MLSMMVTRHNPLKSKKGLKKGGISNKTSIGRVWQAICPLGNESLLNLVPMGPAGEFLLGNSVKLSMHMAYNILGIRLVGENDFLISCERTC
jgi:hypothetical protein